MAIVEYVRALGEGARKRHYHETSRGNVAVFVVQLEVELRGAWVPVVRYDMAHGQAPIECMKPRDENGSSFSRFRQGRL